MNSFHTPASSLHGRQSRSGAFCCFRLLLVCLLSCLGLQAQQAPSGLCFSDLEDGTRLLIPLELSEVVLDVRPGLVEAQLTQTFTNRSSVALEATYLYPLPTGAVVTGFELHYGNRVLVSQVKEKRQARADYEQAKAEGRKTALLEKFDPSLFSTQVSNFLPGETVHVVLRFIQQIPLSKEAVELRFPMTTGTKYFPETAEPSDDSSTKANPHKIEGGVLASTHRYAFDILVSGLPLGRVSSTSHEIAVETMGSDSCRVSLKEEVTVPDRDFVLNVGLREDLQAGPSLQLQRTSKGSFGLLTLFPPAKRAAKSVYAGGRDVLFLIDHSGSMAGPRLQSARLGVQACLGMLDRTDRLQVVQFDDTWQMLFPDWVQADDAGVQKATAMVGQIASRGGTEMQKALKGCLDFINTSRDGRPKILVFLTDGDVGAERPLLNMLKDNIRDTRLFAFAIGDAPNSNLLQKMAQLGQGQVRFVENDAAVARELDSLFATLEAPVFEKIELQLLDASGDVLPMDVLPREVPNVFMGRPIQVSFAGQAGEPAAVQVRAMQSGRRVDFRLPVTGTPLRGDGLEKLYGQQAYEQLLEDVSGSGKTESAEHRAHRLEIALRFGLVTELTSRVLVDSETVSATNTVLASVEVPQVGPGDQRIASGPGSAVGGDEEVIQLSPFCVSADEESGYAANSTLAGTRIRTTLKDIGSAINVITKQFLLKHEDGEEEDSVQPPMYGSVMNIGGAAQTPTPTVPPPTPVTSQPLDLQGLVWYADHVELAPGAPESLRDLVVEIMGFVAVGDESRLVACLLQFGLSPEQQAEILAKARAVRAATRP